MVAEQRLFFDWRTGDLIDRAKWNQLVPIGGHC